VTTGHHTKTTEQHCIIMMRDNSNAEWNRKMDCGVGAQFQEILDDCSWSRSPKLLHGGKDRVCYKLWGGQTLLCVFRWRHHVHSTV